MDQWTRDEEARRMLERDRAEVAAHEPGRSNLDALNRAVTSAIFRAEREPSPEAWEEVARCEEALAEALPDGGERRIATRGVEEAKRKADSLRQEASSPSLTIVNETGKRVEFRVTAVPPEHTAPAMEPGREWGYGAGPPPSGLVQHGEIEPSLPGAGDNHAFSLSPLSLGYPRCAACGARLEEHGNVSEPPTREPAEAETSAERLSDADFDMSNGIQGRTGETLRTPIVEPAAPKGKVRFGERLRQMADDAQYSGLFRLNLERLANAIDRDQEEQCARLVQRRVREQADFRRQIEEAVERGRYSVTTWGTDAENPSLVPSKRNRQDVLDVEPFLDALGAIFGERAEEQPCSCMAGASEPDIERHGPNCIRRNHLLTGSKP